MAIIKLIDSPASWAARAWPELLEISGNSKWDVDCSRELYRSLAGSLGQAQARYLPGCHQSTLTLLYLWLSWLGARLQSVPWATKQ